MHGLIFVHVFQQSLCVCVCLHVLWISHRYMSARQPGQGGAYLKIVIIPQEQEHVSEFCLPSSLPSGQA